MKLLRALPLVVALTGCGTLFNGGPAHVNFTSTPAGAEVSIDGVPRGRTPIVLELPKNQNHTVLFRLAGYDDIGVTLNRKVSAGFVVLDVLGGLVPIAIDAITGGWYVLSTDEVHGTLSRSVGAVPGSGQLTADQLALVRLGVAFDRALELAP